MVNLELITAVGCLIFGFLLGYLVPKPKKEQEEKPVKLETYNDDLPEETKTIEVK